MHFRPARNWMNDPNGLVFHDGVHHLYYQYNPHGADHGFMSWGHASSPDLVSWEEHPVAIRYTVEHEIFSGSAVYDEHDTSGLGAGGVPPLVAVFTLADQPGRHQTQGIASSTDGGLTWTPYPGNPVLDRGSADFRDPKVFRYSGPAGEYWVMIAVEALERRVVLYRSDDLKAWTFLSDYGPSGATGGVWECPDLFPLAVDGDPSEVRWVLLISLNPGGIAGGSGTQYVVGSFDGVRFVADEPGPAVASGRGWENSRAELEACDWLDHGRDCYAGVTFSGLPDQERILIAWMSNWDYAGLLPVDAASPQRGAMTIARRLSLSRRGGRIRLVQTPIGPVTDPDDQAPTQRVLTGSPLELALAPQVRLRVRLRVDEAADDRGAAVELRFGSEQGPSAVLRFADGELSLDRTVGASGMPASFGSVERMPLATRDLLEAEIWVDGAGGGRGSIEVFADGGAAVLTDLVGSAITHVELVAIGAAVQVDELSARAPRALFADAGDGSPV
ncbi:glycoside hydrolase family 32 protein [Microbacterium sp. W4I4]|uniref:glycoside hydrolase family 32 protein n=1 Tax=Microbacterium sp. W4I4 TaxID=3042295 RepID=UPI0027D8B901|nr:glycoside hydrolase family 32 protein [Microbacterium sp. W4I4]